MNRPTASPPPADLVTAWLRRRLGRAVVLSYVAALLLPGPGLWLRRDHTVPIGTVTGLPLSPAPLLLSLVLFSAGLQVPVRELGRLLRKPTALVAGLVLHLAIPLLVIPVVAFGLHRTPDSDGGSGLITTTLPDKPHLLLPVLAYGLLQKTAASRVIRTAGRRHPPCPASP